MPLTPNTRLGPYEITGKLGEGGMGEVYRATDTRLKRDVAIKVLPSAFTQDHERLARFEREAQLLAQLHHTNIASIFGLEEADGTRALVMELVEGPTLAERLEAGPLPFHEALSVALQVAQALEEAHAKGIVHRDLKPQNIKAPIDGKVKVLDFGLAKAMDPAGASGAGSASQLTQSPTLTLGATQLGVILGTAAYMSPEQAKGAAVDKRADIWAFGVVFFEMLTGGRLFDAPTVPETLAQVLTRTPDTETLPASTLRAIRRLLRRCLERNPKNRLHDIADARIVLEEVLASGGVEEGSSVAAAPRGISGREKLAWGLALVASLATIALLSGRLTAPGSTATDTPVVGRFSIVPDEPGNLRSAPVLSPDGRTLVYSLQQEDGKSALWLHSIESGTSRQLAGSEGGSQPFFSPDGKQLGFFAGGQLVRLDLTTGLKQVVMRVADSRGGCWEHGGEMLVSINAASPILRVAPRSGESRPATQLASERGEQSHRFPTALPEGEFLYTSYGAVELRGVWWHPQGDAPPRKILPDMSRTVFDQRGYLLWVRDGVLVAQRFDAATGALSGEISPIAEGINVDEQVGADVWFGASSSGTIAFRAGSAAGLELVWVDRSGKLLEAVTNPARFGEPMLSPDGRQIVVTISVPSQASDVWIYDATRFDQSRRLTFDPAGADTPIWSRDGQWVAYSSPRGDGWGIFRKLADGSGEEELLFDADVGSWVGSFAPGDQSLIFERFTTGSSVDLWILPLDGQQQAHPFLETPSNEGHPMFSPDGRFVAYVSDEDGIGKVYVRSVSASSNRWQLSKGGGDWPAWSADGKELFFAGSDRMLYAVPISSGSPLAFGEPQTLFRLRTQEPRISSYRTSYSPAPDGRRFLVNQLVGDQRDTRIEVVTSWQPPDAAR